MRLIKKTLHQWLCLPLAAASMAAAGAQEGVVSLRMHHFLPPGGILQTDLLIPFVERLEKASNGRLKIELFAGMALGGRPGDLYDQAADGAVDIVLTLPGYTAGRFNRTEVFELPFIMEDAVATSKAFWALIDAELQEAEYGEVQVLSGWVHGPGVMHSKQPIAALEDLRGKEIRGPTRLATDLLGELGAQPVGMPLPKIPESISKGVISATLLPWQVIPSIHLQQLVGQHTEISGARALYTATFILAMNLDAYQSLPADLRGLLDAHTGAAFAEAAGRLMVAADGIGRRAARANGNHITVLSADEVARWVAASRPVLERWVARADEKGFDGRAAIRQAKQLIAAAQ